MSEQSLGNKRIAKNTMALYVRMGITMFLSFFTTRITLDILGFDDFGLNNVVASVVSMFGFINGSMGTAVQRFFSIEIGKNNHKLLARVFGTGLYLHLIVAGITFLLSELFALFFLSKLNIPPERLLAAHWVFQISIVSLVLNILLVPFQALLRAHEAFSKIAMLDVLRAVLKLAVLLLLYRIQYDKLVALSLLNFGITLIYISIIILFARKFEEARFRLLRDKELMSRMLRFISMLVFTVLTALLNKQGIVILVNLFFGLTINAAYAVAFQVSQMLETFAMNFKQAVVPQLMQSFGAKDFGRMNKLIFLGTKVTFLLMVLISIPLIFESEYILKVWLKEVPGHAAMFTVLIAIGVNVNTFYYFVYQAVHASGKIRQQQVLSSVSYLLSVAVIYLSFKWGAGFYYAAIVPIGFGVLRNIIVLKSAATAIGFRVRPYLLKVLVPCFGLVLLLLLLPALFVLLLDASLGRLLLILSANTLSAVGLGYYLVLNKEERLVLGQMFFKK